MRPVLHAALLAGGLALASGPAAAQSSQCGGRLNVGSVTIQDVEEGRGATQRQFQVQLTNTSAQMLLAFMRVGALPNLPLQRTLEIELGAGSSQRVTVARTETWSTLSAAQVQAVLSFHCQ